MGTIIYHETPSSGDAYCVCINEEMKAALLTQEKATLFAIYLSIHY